MIQQEPLFCNMLARTSVGVTLFTIFCRLFRGKNPRFAAFRVGLRNSHGFAEEVWCFFWPGRFPGKCSAKKPSAGEKKTIRQGCPSPGVHEQNHRPGET